MGRLIVVIAGIKRSGSTLLMNIVRFILEQKNIVVPCGSDYQIRDTTGIDLVKIHPFREQLAEAADYVFTSTRPDEDIKESWKRFRGAYPSKELFAKWEEWLNSWEKYSDAHLPYGRIKRHSNEFIEQLAWILGCPCDVSEVQGKINDLSPPSKGFDDKTFLFHNHRTA